jgi:hypothetical protein
MFWKIGTAIGDFAASLAAAGIQRKRRLSLLCYGRGGRALIRSRLSYDFHRRRVNIGKCVESRFQRGRIPPIDAQVPKRQDWWR